MILYNPTVSGSLVVTGSLTTTGTITSQTLVVQTITSSIEFNTGSTRNGTLSTNTHEFTGSVSITGSAAALLSVNNNVLYVSSSGDIGIGVTSISPISTYKTLEIRGATGGGIKLGKTGFNPLNIQHDGTDAYINNVANGAFNIYTNDAPRVIVTSAGSVGIGTSNPTNPLHIETTGADLGIQIYRNVSSDGGSAPLFISHKSTAGTIKTVNIEGIGSGDMLFRTGATGLATFGTTRMTIASTGAMIINSGFNNFQTSTKTASSEGNTTFAYGTDYGRGLGDNTAGLVVINISQTNANITNPSAVWIGTVINPRGSGATITQISTTKGSGISALSVSGNASNEIIVNASTSDGSGYRASMTFIGGGGTT